MNVYSNGDSVEPMDAVLILTDEYKSSGIQKGYVGVVAANQIAEAGYIVVDFFNPFTGETIYPFTKIKEGDFRVLSESREDTEIISQFRNFFRPNENE